MPRRSSSRRPNILLLVGEDTGRYLGCYNDPVARTPNLDRLAAEGCRYDQAYAVAPVCSPSRSCLVTGRYPTSVGTHQHRSRLLDPPRIFTQELRDAGYYVSWHTKLDFNFTPLDGWRDDADTWIDRLAGGGLSAGPWFAYRNFGVTHESAMWHWPAPEGRPGSELERVDPDLVARFPLPDHHSVPVPAYLPDTTAVRADIARHYRNIAVLDYQVGLVLEALASSGASENTIVIFLADHGRGLPREKRWPYTAGIHMPLVIRAPGILEPGGVDTGMVSWVDLAPTILSLAGVAAPEDYEGEVFLGGGGVGRGAFLEGSATLVAPGVRPGARRDRIYAGRDRMDEAFDRVRVVRTLDYHYVVNDFPEIPYAQRVEYMEYCATMQELRRLHAAGELFVAGEAVASREPGAAPGVFMQAAKPAEELYDLRSDPDCVRNLVGDPAYDAVRRDLRADLETWRKRFDVLGREPERRQIDRGLVADRLADYARRIAELPAPYTGSFPRTVLEEPS